MIRFFSQFSLVEKLLLIAIFIVYTHNLFIDIMYVDAAQYSGLSSQMAYTNSYLEVKDFDNDYLDKPPLLFWLSSLSIKVFGINNFAYKLPTFLFLLISIYAVYRFSILYYCQKIAQNAVLILASAQAYFLMTNDVRTDGLLTSSVIISVWLFAEYFEKRSFKNLVYAAIFIAFALMSKGPIGIIAVLLPIGLHLIYLKKWQFIFSFNWLLVVFIVAVLLLPMSYGLYTQFDLHPEKITNGTKGQSGLYFYYWLQSFGRITGENSWNNFKPWHFFITSSLWDFFPWFLPLLFAVFYKLKGLFFQNSKAIEIISLSGFVIIFFMFSLSKYKLPHYVFVTFPFAAVLVAEYFYKINETSWKNWRIFFIILSFIILLLLIIYNLFFFTEINFLAVILIILQICIIYSYFKFNKNNVAQLIILVIMLNVFMSFVFYPKLLTFQSDSVAAKYANKYLNVQNVYIYNSPSYSFNFYTKKPFVDIIDKAKIKDINNTFWLYLSDQDLLDLQDLKLNITKKIQFDDYPITRLKINFLLSKKREQELKHKFLIKIENNHK